MDKEYDLDKKRESKMDNRSYIPLACDDTFPGQ